MILTGKNVLICGGTRQMGIHMVKFLKDICNITLANRGTTNNGLFSDLPLIRYERTDFESCHKAFEGKDFDVVIDFIAYNDTLVDNLLKNITCKKYVQISSNAVYNLAPDQDETAFDPGTFDSVKHFLTGNAAYQLGKMLAEKQALTYGIDTLVIRVPYVTGIHDETFRLEWLVKTIMENTAFHFNKKKYESRFSLVRESEAGRFIQFALEKDLSGIYNISNGIITVKEIIRYIEHWLQKNANIIWGEINKCCYNNVPDSYLNTGKAILAGYSFDAINGWLPSVINFFADKADKLQSSMKGELAATRDALGATRDALAAVQGELGTTKSVLATTRGELEATKSALDTTRGELGATKSVLNTTRGELDVMRRSRSFRIGRLITWMPRKIRGILRV